MKHKNVKVFFLAIRHMFTEYMYPAHLPISGRISFEEVSLKVHAKKVVLRKPSCLTLFLLRKDLSFSLTWVWVWMWVHVYETILDNSKLWAHLQR